jgi:hypothetical protein
MRWAIISDGAGCWARVHPARGGAAAGGAPRPAQRAAAEATQAILQCHADLARERVQFRALPDRRFDGGCSAVGAVQLTEIGTPTTNLGAMTCPWRGNMRAGCAKRCSRRRAGVRRTSGADRDVRDLWLPQRQQPARRADQRTWLCQCGGRGRLRLARRPPRHRRAWWNGADERDRRFLRAVHRGGCQRFSVGLGPDADSLHYNHLHFDLGRSGTCR